MSERGQPTSKTRKRKSTTRKPPPRWRKYLVQAELELPAPEHDPQSAFDLDEDDDLHYEREPRLLPLWQERVFVLGLVVACLVLLAVTAVTLRNASLDRKAAAEAESRARALTLRAVNEERALRIAPNPRSWSRSVDTAIDWPEPPQLIELYFPVGYASYLTYALSIDKVDHGRVMVVERMTPDSNKDLRLALNSSAFGPGEYRIRIQGYTWRGERVDVGWVRLVVDPPG
jgi:hypothetical protein